MKGPLRKARDFALIGRVFAEVGAGRITRAFVKMEGYEVHGLQEGKHVWINEDHLVADSVVHECLHRAFPAWGENYIRRTTSYLMGRMSDAEIQALMVEYRKRARVRKTPVRVSGRIE